MEELEIPEETDSEDQPAQRSMRTTQEAARIWLKPKVKQTKERQKREEEKENKKEISSVGTLKEDLWREVQNQVKALVKEMKVRR